MVSMLKQDNEEHRLKVIEKIQRRIFVSGKDVNKIDKAIKSERLGWIGHEARMGER